MRLRRIGDPRVMRSDGAVAMQRAWRGHTARRREQQRREQVEMRRHKRHSRVLQRAWRLFVARRSVRAARERRGRLQAEVYARAQRWFPEPDFYRWCLDPDTARRWPRNKELLRSSCFDWRAIESSE